LAVRASKEMGKERRKHQRYKCLLPAEILKTGEKKSLLERATIRDFSREGLKLIVNFNLNLGSNMEIKIYLPEKNLTTSIVGEIVWLKQAENRMEAGLKIKDMDKKAREEILNWLLPKWLEDEEKKKKK
jgi:c-di-GMP-binding flagellar brake protein YcgR